ncbi:hypothetical protein [Chryseobacterium indoltheticum]|uniref:hypothetical protein n=1 Tax=Chryseobacterium indoltheticum TaxID=254 RepID=UPI001914170F|nr:hypothetical protein [Chryseobacterium indoltheticum]QQQ29153.1 hypothetical protein JJL46_03850 [Chryseobacterium indoltheticum]
MQFIDFKKEHFSHNEAAGSYFIQISKDEIGYRDIEVLEQLDDETYSKTEYELVDEVSKITIKMKDPTNIRVNF